MVTRFDQRKRVRSSSFLVAADCLITALENMRHDSALRPIRGDLHELHDKVEHMRRVVERQPTDGYGPWVFMVSGCLWQIVDAFSGLPDSLIA
jgi:hypothetical protein